MFKTKVQRPFFVIGTKGLLIQETLEFTVTITHGDADVILVRKLGKEGAVILNWDFEEIGRIYDVKSIIEDAVTEFDRVDSSLEVIVGTHLRKVG